MAFTYPLSLTTLKAYSFNYTCKCCTCEAQVPLRICHGKRLAHACRRGMLAAASLGRRLRGDFALLPSSGASETCSGCLSAAMSGGTR